MSNHPNRCFLMFQAENIVDRPDCEARQNLKEVYRSTWFLSLTNHDSAH